MFFDALFSRRRSSRRTSTQSARKKNRTWLELQYLEDRCVPAGLNGQAIITKAYPDMLDRPVDPSGLATWGNYIDAGGSAAVAAMGIADSDDWTFTQINQLYSQNLGRAPGQSDASVWSTFMSNGGTYHEMVLLITSSDEAFQHAGGTNDTWLAQLFTNVIGRPIDSGTQTQLDKLFTAGLNRAQIDAIVLNTAEYNANLVRTTYQTFLGRPVDDATLVFQVQALQAGFTFENLQAGIVGTLEFANQATNGTTTSVTASASTSVTTQPVTFTATVSPTNPNGSSPTGLVTFLDNGTPIGTATLGANGQASFTSTALTLGANTITASYGGDATFGTSSGTTSVTVSAANTTTTLSSSANPSVFGQTVNLSATVSVSAPGSGFASGTVNFVDQTTNTTLGTGTINAVTGVATLAVSNLTVGTHSIVATYVPGAQKTFNASTSAPVSQVVNQSNSTTAVSTSTTPSVFGQQITLTAVVAAASPGLGTPTGSVTFKDATTNTTLGTANLSSGTATLNVSNLGVGQHSITATYSGDTNFTTSSGSTTQQVNQASTKTVVTSSTPTSVFGQPVVFTATVTATAPGGGIPTGTVTFTDENNNVLGTGTLNSSGVATLTYSALPVGGHTISANYGGDNNFLTSGGTTSQTVNQASTTTVAASNINAGVFGQPVTFSATVTATSPATGIPTGTVTFKDTTTNTTLGTANLNASGVATLLPNATLTAGSHNIVATYNGDTNYVSSAGSVGQVVNKASTAVALSSNPNPSNSGAQVLFTAVVSAVSPGAGIPTGSVIFMDTTTNTNLGPGTLDNTGTATVTATLTGVETHVIVATYQGDSNFNTSQSSPFNQVVQ